MFKKSTLRNLRNGNIVVQLIIIQVVFFVLVQIAQFSLGSSVDIIRILALPASLPTLITQPWSVLTSAFLHDSGNHADWFGNILHLGLNMLWLYWIGNLYADFLKAKQVLTTFLVGCAGGAVLFLLLFNAVPYFFPYREQAYALGASAGVFAILTAAATLTPDYELMVFMFRIRLKYLALIIVLTDLIGISIENAGGHFAHLGGALAGFLYVKNLYHTVIKWPTLFRRKTFKPTVYQRNSSAAKTSAFPNQAEIDAILDKISQSGYDSLNANEKEKLFKAGNR